SRGRAADRPPGAARERAAPRRGAAVRRPRRGARAGPGRRGPSVPGPAHPRRGPVTAREIAAAVRSGDRSARSVVEEHLDAIRARDGEIHAFNLVMEEDALAAADAVDAAVGRGEDPGPLAGVPVALKDNLCTRGVATTCSSKILDAWEPPYTATVV